MFQKPRKRDVIPEQLEIFWICWEGVVNYIVLSKKVCSSHNLPVPLNVTGHIIDVINFKMRSYRIWVGFKSKDWHLYPKRREHAKTQRKVNGRQKQRLEWCSDKPKNTKDFWKPLEAKMREIWDSFSLRASSMNQPCANTFILESCSPELWKNKFPSFSHLVCGNFFWQP